MLFFVKPIYEVQNTAPCCKDIVGFCVNNGTAVMKSGSTGGIWQKTVERYRQSFAKNY